VSPTYFGMAADVAGCAEVAHRAGIPLVVDQAWGPHFGFHDALPPTALSQGADAMLTSTHKIAGSLTQSAMLHIGDSGRIDPAAIARSLRLLRSTSPSSLLLVSLDGSRRQLVLHGEQLLFETLEAIEVARAKLLTIPGIALVDASLIGRMGVAGYDPLRIVLDVRGTGRTGYEIANALRRSYDVHVELPMQATVVFLVGLGESAAALRRLAGDVDEVVKRLMRPGATAPIIPPAASLGYEVVVPPRDAFLGEAELVAVDDAVGRISCESIAAYPPGVPALLPGERISAETVLYLRDLAESGARLHGASDPRFETINVLQEAG
jgi:arginine decarboxylase